MTKKIRNFQAINGAEAVFYLNPFSGLIVTEFKTRTNDNLQVHSIGG